MRFKDYALPALVLIALLVAGFNTPTALAEASLASVKYVVYYDPYGDAGFLYVTLVLSAQPGILVNISIPARIFEDSSLELLNYTGSGVSSLIAKYDDITGLALVLCEVNTTSPSLTMYFSLTNATREIIAGSYTSTLNLLWYQGGSMNLQVEVYLAGVFNATITPLRDSSSYRVNIIDNTTAIVFTSPTMYFIVLTTPVSIITPSPTTPSPTLPPGVTGTPTTTPPGASPTQTPTLLPVPQGSPWGSLLLLAVVLAIIAVAAAVFVWRRSYVGKIEVADIMSDTVARSIIRLLGEANGSRLTQAEVTSRTGFPKSSVSRRIKRLEEEGYITVERTGKYNYLELTPKGWEAYKRITGRK